MKVWFDYRLIDAVVFADKLADFIGAFKPEHKQTECGVCVCVSKSRLEFFSIICRNVKFSMNEFQCICFCPSLSWSPPPPNLIEQNLLFELASFALAQSTHNLCTWTYIKSNIKTKQNGKCELMPEGKQINNLRAGDWFE